MRSQHEAGVPGGLRLFRTGVNLGHHFRWSPHCEAASKQSASRKRERPAKRDRTACVSLFQNRVAGEISKFFLHAHIDHYISLTQLDTFRGLLRVCASLTTEFIEEELHLDDCPADKSIFETARRAFDILPNMNTMINQRRRLYARAVPRHLTAIETGADRKGAAFFNAHEVLTIMLQECAAVRKVVIAASEKWKTGTLFKTRPKVLADLTDGTRFLDWEAVCGKATEEEANDLRVVLHAWTDEFTPIDGLSQNARNHKYGALLACLVNLPHQMRHYADNVLLLALYNSRCMPARI